MKTLLNENEAESIFNGNFLECFDPDLQGIKILKISRDSQFDTSSWKTIVNIECKNERSELFSVDVRESWNSKVFLQNLYDHTWTVSSLSSKYDRSKRSKIIIYLCHSSTGIENREKIQSVPQEFILGKQWSDIKHVYVDISNRSHEIFKLLVALNINNNYYKLTTDDEINCIKNDQKDNSVEILTPLISIITIVFNGGNQLERTIQSVIAQENVNLEYIIIDGGSTDNTIDILKKYSPHIDKWVSEKDNGIYDAMNKGINLARGEWLNFMNCGDIFYNHQSLNSVKLDTEVDFYYSDVIHYSNSKRNAYLMVNSHEKKNINHQAIVYQKRVHENYEYLVHDNLTISDYFFFRKNDNRNWCKIRTPLSIYNTEGISGSSANHFIQKLFVDFIHGDISESKMIAIMIEKKIKKVVKKILRKFI